MPPKSQTKHTDQQYDDLQDELEMRKQNEDDLRKEMAAMKAQLKALLTKQRDEEVIQKHNEDLTRQVQEQERQNEEYKQHMDDEKAKQEALPS